MSTNTIAINRRMDRFDQHGELWLFGYGSLIWKADFPYLERRRAHLTGWARRFWQGSHDHRGTPAAPGRVVTLVPEAGATCAGMAYLITPGIFDQLDLREKNGYLRHVLTLHLDGGNDVEGLVYVAGSGNAAYLGPAPDVDIARQISAAGGPSGSNREYLLRLAESLRELGEEDAHVFALERRLLASDEASPGRPRV